MVDLKRNEARILIYLNSTAPYNRFAYIMSPKLDIDVASISRVIARFIQKRWIRKIIYDGRKQVLELTKLAPIKEAKKRLAEE